MLATINDSCFIPVPVLRLSTPAKKLNVDCGGFSVGGTLKCSVPLYKAKDWVCADRFKILFSLYSAPYL